MATSKDRQTLKLAVCLFDDVTTLDFQGPLEHLGFLARWNVVETAPPFTRIDSKFIIDSVFLGPSTDPVRPCTGPLMIPTRTYDSVGEDEQFDMILVPGGPGAQPEAVPPSLLSFIKRQAPGATYVLSACTGSWVLAHAGVLRGKRATTNKASLQLIRDLTTELGVTWVAKARWVVDGKYWTSSGVTAGIDMSIAFLTHLIGEALTTKIRGLSEASVRGEGDDEYAEFHGLV
ncbi:class I glutamine amidotransferase-like protein [Cristinia sonorae]|uniref:Class I glutamine amidotransferase-like protein n=1 Tax=Cristinia sonorae TaxID=1940300 RepID=A0A8K0UCG6_9AGAR|nr:class I glutamine amidotransferase-like protein [Cristinia sonorae]